MKSLKIFAPALPELRRNLARAVRVVQVMKHLTSMIAALPLALISSITSADDFRVNYLEQEVRELKRQVLSLTQRLDQVTTRPPREPSTVSRNMVSERPAPETTWVDAKKWKSLRRGMSELEVIELLGRPSTTRNEGGARVVLYAMEIGDSGFLGGSVRFRDGIVDEIRQPTLQ